MNYTVLFQAPHAFELRRNKSPPPRADLIGIFLGILHTVDLSLAHRFSSVGLPKVGSHGILGLPTLPSILFLAIDTVFADFCVRGGENIPLAT